MVNKVKENKDQMEDQIDEKFQADGEDSEMPDPAPTGSSRRSADNTAGDSKTPLKQDDKGDPLKKRDDVMKKLPRKGASTQGGGSQTPTRRADKREGEFAIPYANMSKEDVNMDEFDALMEASDFSDNFKSQAALGWQATVVAAVDHINEQLTEAYNEALDEQSERDREAMVETLDKFLCTMLDKWADNNEVAIDEGLRNQLNDSLTQGIFEVFAEHNIEVPEGKIDPIEELQTERDELVDLVNAVVAENAEYRQIIENAEREAIIDDIADDAA